MTTESHPAPIDITRVFSTSADGIRDGYAIEVSLTHVATRDILRALARRAYIAAANRAQQAIKTYPQAPAIEEAMYILVSSYDKMGMTDLRDDADRVMKKNFPNSRFYKDGLERKTAWWKLW